MDEDKGKEVVAAESEDKAENEVAEAQENETSATDADTAEKEDAANEEKSAEIEKEKSESDTESIEASTEEEWKPKKKANKKKIAKIAVIVVASLLLIMGGVFAVMYFTKSGIFAEAPASKQKPKDDEKKNIKDCLSQGGEYDKQTKECRKPAKNDCKDSEKPAKSPDIKEIVEFNLEKWDFKRIDTPDCALTLKDGWKIYKLGEDANGAELYEVRTNEAEDEYTRYIVNKKGRYQYTNRDSINIGGVSPDLGLGEIEYLGISIAKLSLEYKGITFAAWSNGNWSGFGWQHFINYYEKTGGKATKLANSPYNGFYQVETGVDNSNTVKNTSYFVELPDGRAMQVYNEFADHYIDSEHLKLSSGDNDKSFVNLYGGCGTLSGETVLINKPSANELELVGNVVTDSGKKVKAYTSSSEKIWKLLYDKEYNPWDTEKLTYEVFKTKFTHIIIEDGLGNWVLYASTEFHMPPQCGKPVIYLYPEKTGVFDVAVGADVKLSDPEYPTGGWKNVIASPNGKLRYNGQDYDSLFWEGTGQGIYPSKKGEGVVVAHDKAASTIRKQLKAQGMNAKETSDFMAFWEEKIPQAKYVRLTWLNTEDMNLLAPLYVSKKPDTLIRVFLEMEGMDKKVNLTEQKFHAPARRGFVVTEWGGLLYGSI
ncbi:hypothetical protein FWF74_01475 [Candidatus Saccharibacteria bacterium]|nr:hypothetical protein [Candidatus Saccharibacteria bacterium]MCL1963118.1 hypothetical protein [Candidatus Saccharibacteria bacterium]